MKFVIIQRIFTLLFILLLIALFIFPSQLIHSVYLSAAEDIHSAISAAESDNMQKAAMYSKRVLDLLEDKAVRIKWFVNHSIVNEVILEAELTYKLCLLDDKNAAVAALIALQTAMEALHEVEHFNGNTLL